MIWGMAITFQIKTPQAKSMKELIDKLDFIKIKNFCFAKDTVKRRKREAEDGEKIFAEDISNKRTSSRIYKEIIMLNKKQIRNLVKNWEKI